MSEIPNYGGPLEAKPYRSWWTEHTTVPYGYCWCGCGSETKIARKCDRLYKWVAGEPRRFLAGHVTILRGQIRRAEIYNAETGEKKCAACEKWKLATPDHFHRQPTWWGGLHSRCKECESERNKATRKANPMLWTTKKRRYDARKRGAEGRHTPGEVWAMAEDQSHLCAYCEEPLFGYYHVDHMIPVSRGGRDDWTNLAITCARCNREKNDKTVEEFIEWIG